MQVRSLHSAWSGVFLPAERRTIKANRHLREKAVCRIIIHAVRVRRCVGSASTCTGLRVLQHPQAAAFLFFKSIIAGMRRICKMPAEPEKAKEANNPLRFETEGIVVDRAPGPRPNVTVFCAGSGEGGAVFSAGNRFHYTRVRLECQYLYSQPLHAVWPVFFPSYCVDFPCNSSGLRQKISLSDEKNPRPSGISRL